MSLDIRYLTNGTKTVFTVRNSGVKPIIFEIFDKREDIDESIRHYAPIGAPVHCEPDLARMFGVLDLFYPEHPNCPLQNHKGEICIAESCRYSGYSGEAEQGTCPLIGTPLEWRPFGVARVAT